MTSFVVSDTQTGAYSLSSFETGIITDAGAIVSASSFVAGVRITGQGAKLIVEGDILREMSAVGGAGTFDGGVVTPISLSMTVGAEAALRTASGDAVNLLLLGSIDLVNEGSITGGNTLFTINGTEDGDALFLSGIAGSVARIANAGTMGGTNGGVELVDFATVEMANDGLIQGGRAAAIELRSVRTGATFSLVNTGVLAANPGGAAITVAGARATIENQGTISGSILLGTGDDRYFGAVGVLSGLIDAGAGNDLLVGGVAGEELYGGAGNDRLGGRGGSDVLDGGAGADVLQAGEGDDQLAGGLGLDDLYGGDGDDRMFGGDANDALFGGSGDDTLAGEAGNDGINAGAGHDTVSGGAGIDTIFGADGDDILSGDTENDALTGGLGEDSLFGGTGNDVLRGGGDGDVLAGGTGTDQLFGGAGDDVIAGNAGLDQLTGGAGADQFDFDAASDSLVGSSDLILDFTRGEDTIDLVDATTQPIVFRGTAAFAGGGQASARYVTSASGDANVFLDLDGNGTADMRFVLFGVPVVSESDFLF